MTPEPQQTGETPRILLHEVLNDAATAEDSGIIKSPASVPVNIELLHTHCVGKRVTTKYKAAFDELTAAYIEKERELTAATARIAELEAMHEERGKEITGVLEECSKHISLSNDFPWEDEVYCAFRSLEGRLAALETVVSRMRHDLELVGDAYRRLCEGAYGEKGPSDRAIVIQTQVAKTLALTLPAVSDRLAESEKALGEARNAHRIQQENYLGLYYAVMGDGTMTAEFRGAEEFAISLRARIAELEADACRLDWLEGKGVGRVTTVYNIWVDSGQKFRAAIDTAMSATHPKEPQA